jgi:hypothetical protein
VLPISVATRNFLFIGIQRVDQKYFVAVFSFLVTVLKDCVLFKFLGLLHVAPHGTTYGCGILMCLKFPFFAGFLYMDQVGYILFFLNIYHTIELTFLFGT